MRSYAPFRSHLISLILCLTDTLLTIATITTTVARHMSRATRPAIQRRLISCLFLNAGDETCCSDCFESDTSLQSFASPPKVSRSKGTFVILTVSGIPTLQKKHPSNRRRLVAVFKIYICKENLTTPEPYAVLLQESRSVPLVMLQPRNYPHTLLLVPCPTDIAATGQTENLWLLQSMTMKHLNIKQIRAGLPL